MKIGTLMLGVRELPRAVAFWRDVLGFAVKLENPEIAFLDGGNVMVALRHVADLATASDERREEVVLHVEDVQSAYEALRAKGVTFRVAPRVVIGDRWAADFRDPDGHVLSIFGPNGALGK